MPSSCQKRDNSIVTLLLSLLPPSGPSQCDAAVQVYTHANVLCIESFILMYDTARVELLLMPLLLSKPLGSGSNRCALCAASYGSTGPFILSVQVATRH